MPVLRSPKLYICGLGHCPPRTATIAVLHALGRCDVVYVGAGSQARQVISDYCPGVPLRRYEEAGAESGVLKELSRGRTVGVASVGHPFVLDELAGPLLRRCRKRGIGVETFGAVSALDVVLAALGKSLGLDIRGVQVFTASKIASGSAVIQRHWLIVTFPKQCGRTRQRDIARELGRHYPLSHPCWILGPGPEESPSHLPFADIEDRIGNLRPGAIFVAPPLPGGARR